MAVNQDIVDLINADIDGELPAEERERLQGALQADPEAQALYDDMASLCQSLDAMEALEPPAHLKHQILDTLQHRTRPRPVEPLWKRLLALHPLHYVGTFAAGSLVTFLIFSSNQISDRAFDDVTDLVGTLGTQIDDVGQPGSSVLNLTAMKLAGTIKAHREGSIMVIDFDLTAVDPVEIVAEFADPDVWFNGFAQLENDGTSVSAESGRVSMRMAGKRRYAMYLHNASGAAATVNLQFISAGQIIYEDILTFDSAD